MGSHMACTGVRKKCIYTVSVGKMAGSDNLDDLSNEGKILKYNIKQ